VSPEARSGTPLLEARDLRAGYGRTEALSGLDARLLAGEVVAILGENGSGKSTLLKVIARILPPSSGQMLLDGAPLSALSRRQTARRIAYLPQSVDLVFPILALDLVLQGLARALEQEAEIWLLDEPTAGLDPRHRLEFLQVLRRSHRERGGTVLLVTHEIDLAAEICDRVLLLRRGRALADGPPDDVLTAANLRRAFDVEFQPGASRFRAKELPETTGP
jgi:iron complex transport system ATP-binding protein